MPPESSRGDRHRIADMLEAIARVRRCVEGMDYERFTADEKTQSAVLYNLYVIGEAGGHLSEQTKASAPHIPWRQIRGMRNVLAHVYFGIQFERVWATIRDDLPVLEQALRELAT